MALPVFRAAGAKSTGTTGATAVAAPAGLVAGDLEVLVATTIAGGSISITTAGGGAWTAVPNTPIDVTAGEKLYVWYREFAPGDSSPSVTPGSDHVCAARLAYKVGTFDRTTPIEVAVSSTEATSDTSFSWAPGTSTTVNDCLVLVVSTSGVDSNTAQVPVCTNASLTALASRANYNTTSGGGGGFGVTEGAKATAGTTGTFACTYAGASPKAYASFAIRPYSAASFPTGDSLLDDFNRADNASLGDEWLDGAFGTSADAKILSNQLAANATTAPAFITTTLADGDFSVEIPTLSGTNFNLLVRCANYATGSYDAYQLQTVIATKVWNLNKVVAGVSTLIATGTFATYASGDAIGIRTNGDFFEVWKRTSGTWAYQGGGRDATFSAAGAVGLVLWDTTVRADNLRGPKPTSTTWDGEATLAATSVTLAVAGQRETDGAATLAATSVALAAAGTIEKVGAATLAITPVALSVAAQRDAVGVATLAAPVTLAAAATLEAVGAATIATSVTLTAAGATEKVGAATLATTPVSIAAAAVKELVGTATIAAPVALAADSVRDATGAATLSNPVTIAAIADRDAVGVATLAIATALSASASRDAVSAATLPITTSLAASAERDTFGAATIPLLVSFDVEGIVDGAVQTWNGAATLAIASPSLTASGVRDAVGAATLAFASSLDAAATREAVGDATLHFTPATVDVEALREAVGAATLSNPVTLAAAAFKDAIASATLAINVNLIATSVVDPLVPIVPPTQDELGDELKREWLPITTWLRQGPGARGGRSHRGWGPRFGQGAR